MLRPRESRDLQLASHRLYIFPQANVTWALDVFGNSVATAYFSTAANTLSIHSQADVELHATPWPVFDIAADAALYPFRYSDDDWTDLAALAAQQYPDPDGQLHAWAHGFVFRRPTDTLALLKDLCAGIPAMISYQSRDDEGTQSPLQTLHRGWGSCRDFAVLFAEAARCLHFGARIVSGYLFNPESGLDETIGTTHAWAEVFVPGAGWITFDPTNRGVGGFNLIPVAVARNILQVIPVAGSFTGMTNAYAGMTVEVRISSGNHG